MKRGLAAFGIFGFICVAAPVFLLSNMFYDFIYPRIGEPCSLVVMVLYFLFGTFIALAAAYFLGRGKE